MLPNFIYRNKKGVKHDENDAKIAILYSLDKFQDGIFEWTPLGLLGGGSMYALAISACDPNLMMINCDMSCVFIS